MCYDIFMTNSPFDPSYRMYNIDGQLLTGRIYARNEGGGGRKKKERERAGGGVKVSREWL